MDKYKVKYNREGLSEKDLEKGKDFDKVRYRARTMKSNGLSKTLVGFSVVASLAFLGLYLLKNNAGSENVENVRVLPNDANQPVFYTVESGRDTSLVYKTGTVIHIPAAAFRDKMGKPVKGKVELHYREFHDPGELLLSGIPMTYDSAGNKYDFESAGMFELYGFQNDQPVFIQNDKKIEVAMVSADHNATKFNKYIYNTADKKWSCLGKDKADVLNVKQYEGHKQEKESRHYESHDRPSQIKGLFKPAKFDPERYHFTIEVDQNDFPELAVYDKIVFEVLPENKNYDPNTANLVWDNAILERTSTLGKYKVTFVRGDKRYLVMASVVVSSMDKPEINADKMDQAYKQKQKEKTEREEASDQKIQAEVKTFERIAGYYRMKEELDMKRAQAVEKSEEVVYRTFQVSQFAIYNSDCASTLPLGQLVHAEFRARTGEPISVAAVYLVENGKNALYSLGIPKTFSFNPNSDNLLIVITKDNSLAWFSKEDFKSIARGDKSVIFKLNTKRQLKYTPEDINKLI